MSLPNPGMTIDTNRTALVITDPQNDFLSPEGVTWGVVGESVTENNTVDNIERLFQVSIWGVLSGNYHPATASSQS